MSRRPVLWLQSCRAAQTIAFASFVQISALTAMILVNKPSQVCCSPGSYIQYAAPQTASGRRAARFYKSPLLLHYNIDLPGICRQNVATRGDSDVMYPYLLL